MDAFAAEATSLLESAPAEDLDRIHAAIRCMLATVGLGCLGDEDDGLTAG